MKRILRENERIGLLLEYFPSGLKASGSSALELRHALIEAGLSLCELSAKGKLVASNAQEPELGSLGYTSIFAQRDGLSLRIQSGCRDG